VKIGMLTGGGDLPGPNAVLAGVGRQGEPIYAAELRGVRDGSRGVSVGGTPPPDGAALRGPLPRGADETG